MDEYPNPWTTMGMKTENAWLGTLAQILNTNSNQSFQSFEVSTTSRFVSRFFHTLSSLYAWAAEGGLSSEMRCAANICSSDVRNQADFGPWGNQNQATNATSIVTLPSIMNRICQFSSDVWLRWNMPYASGTYVNSTATTVHLC